MLYVWHAIATVCTFTFRPLFIVVLAALFRVHVAKTHFFYTPNVRNPASLHDLNRPIPNTTAHLMWHEISGKYCTNECSTDNRKLAYYRYVEWMHKRMHTMADDKWHSESQANRDRWFKIFAILNEETRIHCMRRWLTSSPTRIIPNYHFK